MKILKIKVAVILSFLFFSCNNTDIIISPSEEIDSTLSSENSIAKIDSMKKTELHVNWIQFHGLNEDEELIKDSENNWNPEFYEIDLEDDYLKIYFEFFIYSPDSTFAIDLDSYSRNITKDKKGNLVTFGSEVDSKVRLINLKNATACDVMFCGTDCTPENAEWQDENSFNVFCLVEENGNFYLTLYNYNLENKIFKKYKYNQNSNRFNTAYTSKIRLKKVVNLTY